MQLTKYSKAAQKVLVHSQMLCKARQNPSIEPEHLAHALLSAEEFRELLKKKQLDFKKIEHALSILLEGLPVQMGYEIALGSRFLQVLAKASAIAIAKNHELIEVPDIFMALMEMRDKLGTLGAVLTRYFLSDREEGKTENVARKEQPQNQGSIAEYCRNFSEDIKANRLPKTIARTFEIERLIQILSRKGRNNCVLVGDPGVGRRSIVIGLTSKLVERDVPTFLIGKEIIALELAELIAGTNLRGQFEERMLRLLKELRESKGQYVLFIPDLSILMGAGGEGASDAANLLKPALINQEIQVIALATPDTFKKRIEADASLERLFQPLWIEQPSLKESEEILLGLKNSFEEFHGVFIEDEAIKAAVDLSAKHLSRRVLPQSAIDVLDEASSHHRILMDKKPAVIKNLHDEIIAKEMSVNADDKNAEKVLSAKKAELLSWQQAYQEQISLIESMRSIKKELKEARLSMESAAQKGDIEKALHWQNVVIKELIDELARESEAFIKTKQLVDPYVKREDIAKVISLETGIQVQQMMESEREKLSKMEEILATQVIGQKEAIEAVCDAIKRSRVGLQDLKKPIGSFLFMGPTGVGKTELARALTTFLFDDERAMIRFDMSEFMEKQSVARLIGAPPGYQGFDEGGQLTETVRRKPYSVVLFDEIEKAHHDVLNILLQVLDEGRLTDSAGNLVNFNNTVIIMTSNVGADLLLNLPKASGKALNVRQEVMEKLLSHLRPEMVNRIDEIVMFNPLEKEDIEQIFLGLLKKLTMRLKDQNITLILDEKAQAFIIDQGFDRSFGARPLKRAMQRYLENPIAEALVREQFVAGAHIVALLHKNQEIQLKANKS